MNIVGHAISVVYCNHDVYLSAATLIMVLSVTYSLELHNITFHSTKYNRLFKHL